MPINLPEALNELYENRRQDLRQAAEAAALTSAPVEILESLELVCVFSDFVAETCTRDPSLPAAIIDSGDLTRRYSRDEFDQKLQLLLSNVSTEDELSRVLRQWRRREFIRIAWRDLSGRADLSKTVSDLSNFADACLEHTLNILYQWQCSQYGQPTAFDGSKQHLVILTQRNIRRHLHFC